MSEMSEGAVQNCLRLIQKWLCNSWVSSPNTVVVVIPIAQNRSKVSVEGEKRVPSVHCTALHGCLQSQGSANGRRATAVVLQQVPWTREMQRAFLPRALTSSFYTVLFLSKKTTGANGCLGPKRCKRLHCWWGRRYFWGTLSADLDSETTTTSWVTSSVMRTSLLMLYLMGENQRLFREEID